ncbi:DUF397 domain-containing protein [Streptomyces sp. M19]
MWPHRAATTAVPTRDSKNPTGPELAITAKSFTTFIASIKVGKFNAA